MYPLIHFTALIQALQYRCSETERREQEALLYIKDCLKLVEQTQHEKEQLVIQVRVLNTRKCFVQEVILEREGTTCHTGESFSKGRGNWLIGVN